MTLQCCGAMIPQQPPSPVNFLAHTSRSFGGNPNADPNSASPNPMKCDQGTVCFRIRQPSPMHSGPRFPGAPIFSLFGTRTRLLPPPCRCIRPAILEWIHPPTGRRCFTLFSPAHDALPPVAPPPSLPIPLFRKHSLLPLFPVCFPARKSHRPLERCPRWRWAVAYVMFPPNSFHSRPLDR